MATKTETLTLRIGPKLKADLELAAAREEMTVSEVARYILAEWMRRPVSD